jgi:hypothetical protein
VYFEATCASKALTNLAWILLINLGFPFFQCWTHFNIGATGYHRLQFKGKRQIGKKRWRALLCILNEAGDDQSTNPPVMPLDHPNPRSVGARRSQQCDAKMVSAEVCRLPSLWLQRSNLWRKWETSFLLVGSAALERVPINWNQLIGKTTLYFRVLERLFLARMGEKRSNLI